MGCGRRALDIAMTIVGTCYDTASNRLNLSRSQAFLASYQTHSKLEELERHYFLPFLRYRVLEVAKFQHSSTELGEERCIQTDATEG